jgi:hypothetical protein
MKRVILAVQICGLLGFLSRGYFAQAEDWRQFRGENSNGRSESLEVPSEWSGTKNMLWRAALLGPGSSSPIVSGSSVFVTCYSGYGVGAGDPGVIDELVRHVICLERTNGKILWDGCEIGLEKVKGVKKGSAPVIGYFTSKLEFWRRSLCV